MDFGLSEDQVLLQASIRRYLEGECPTTRVRTVMESADGHDVGLWKGLAELGVTGLAVPADHGGAGMELLDVALAAEEMGRACTPGPFLGAVMASIALVECGNAKAQERWLPAIASGDAVVTFALGEAIGEWDAAKLTTRAERGALTGLKPLVPYGGVADAILVAAQDAEGPGLWLVERGATGLQTSTLDGSDMTRRLSRVQLEGVRAEKLCGGRVAIDRARDAGLILIAADCFGGSTKALEMTRDYVMTREQFGQAIGAFQGVKHQLADLATMLEPSRSLWWYAAHAFDQIRDQAERHAALAKAHSTDIYDRAVRTAIELHGGIGFTWEFDLQLWFRRSLFNRAFLGEAAYQRERAAELAGW